MKRIIFTALFGLSLLTGCSFPGAATPTPTQVIVPMNFLITETPLPLPTLTPTPAFTPTATPIPPVAANVCSDPQVTAMIDGLKRSMQTSDGTLLSSLVGPQGMKVNYFHNGRTIVYSPYQAQFLFETTYQAPWGDDPASGAPKKGAFHQVIVPSLRALFNQPYTLHCNEVRVGPVNYPVKWPYNRDFYAIHYAGTQQNGNLDWQTWVVGVDYVNGKPTIYALMNFFWEP